MPAPSFQSPRVQPRTASVVLRQLFDIIKSRRTHMQDIATALGLRRETLYTWKRGRSTPDILTVEAIVEILGYRLELVPTQQGDHPMPQSSYDFTGIPPHLQEGLNNWLCHGTLPGSFLRGILSNDFIKAVTRADRISEEALPTIARWLVHNAPEGSYGSPEVLTNWPLYLQALERQAEQARFEELAP